MNSDTPNQILTSQTKPQSSSPDNIMQYLGSINNTSNSIRYMNSSPQFCTDSSLQLGEHSISPEPSDMTGEGGIRGPPQACLFIASLAPETTESTLRNFFGSFGELIRIRLVNNPPTRPYAFVQFKTIEAADEALKASDNQTIDGRKLRIERARVNRTLFIAKIDRNLSVSQLREIMEEHGEVENVTIIKNHFTQKSKGCGFVKYLYREDATNAFAALKNSQKKWVIEWAQSNNDPETLGIDKCNLFVGGLNPSMVTKDLLQERFSQYGSIQSVTLVNKDPEIHEAQDQNFPRSAFAFIRFTESASSGSAIEQENGSDWLNRKIRVQYCESQEMKNKRKANKYYNFVQSYGTHYYPRPGQVPYVYPYGMYDMSNPQLPYDQKGVEMTQAEYQQYMTMLMYGNQPWVQQYLQQQYFPQEDGGEVYDGEIDDEHRADDHGSSGNHGLEELSNNLMNGMSIHSDGGHDEAKWRV